MCRNEIIIIIFRIRQKFPLKLHLLNVISLKNVHFNNVIIYLLTSFDQITAKKQFFSDM